MNEFAKMIYEQWIRTQEGEDFNWGDEYDETWKKLYDILNEKVATDIECSVNKRVWEVQEKAFIARKEGLDNPLFCYCRYYILYNVNNFFSVISHKIA